jgi:hypothetical protein
MPAWQPVMSAGTVIPPFFAVAMIFFAVSGFILYFHLNVKSVEHDYTKCQSLAGGQSCEAMSHDEICSCQFQFTLDHDWKGPVFVYYQLTNFYQSYR